MNKAYQSLLSVVALITACVVVALLSVTVYASTVTEEGGTEIDQQTYNEIMAYFDTQPLVVLTRSVLTGGAEDGLITYEDLLQGENTVIVTAPVFLQTVPEKNIRYAVTKKDSCEDVKFRKKTVKMSHLKKDGIYHICVQATKGEFTWNSDPLQVVRKSGTFGRPAVAFVDSASVECPNVEPGLYQSVHTLFTDLTDIAAAADIAPVTQYMCSQYFNGTKRQKRKSGQRDRVTSSLMAYKLYKLTLNKEGTILDKALVQSWENELVSQ